MRYRISVDRIFSGITNLQGLSEYPGYRGNSLPTFRTIEDYLIVEAPKLSEGDCADAALILGVTRQTISKRFKYIESVYWRQQHATTYREGPLVKTRVDDLREKGMI